MSKQTELAQVADTITVDSGNVGIGTSLTPSGSSASSRFITVAGSGDGVLQLTKTGSGGGAVASAAGTGMLFYTHTGTVGSESYSERLRIDSSGNVGIGFSNPDAYIADASSLVVKGQLRAQGITNTAAVPVIGVRDDNTGFYLPATNTLGITTNGSERMRIDSSGNLLVGKTSATASDVGIQAQPIGRLYATRDSDVPLVLRRNTSDGKIAQFLKNGTNVGSIGVANSRLYIASNNGSSGSGLTFTSNDFRPTDEDGLQVDNTKDVGDPSYRFDDIYATNGTIQTSDQNEKQDIEVLSDAETRVAQACKGLLRKFRWRDAVEAKGDAARIHFGIIAQDLQAAFASEGLDAGRYAMFISSTWWEHDVDVPAVEAVAEVTETTTDEDGNEVVTVVTEAVEAKDAYTRTDTYETQEEAPEGATERTRLGVRYSELLAFIIGAL